MCPPHAYHFIFIIIIIIIDIIIFNVGFTVTVIIMKMVMMSRTLPPLSSDTWGISGAARHTSDLPLLALFYTPLMRR